MGFYIQDDFWAALEDAPEKVQDRAFGAMIRLYFTGAETELRGQAKTAYLLAHDRILLAKRNSQNASKKKRNGKRNETANEKRNETANENGNETANETVDENGTLLLKSKSKRKNITYNSTIAATSSTPESGENESGGGGEEWIHLLGYAVSAYNAKFGTTFPRFTIRAREGIKQAWKDGRREPDIDKALRIAATWDEKFRTPDAVFGEKFEQWLSKPEPREEPEGYVPGGIFA